ncbi:immunity protein YezG family protein [Chryseobacterium oranimense]|uniref:immunity protein YezG family protein n=1 Tax=Chryseobacterium oranimense TaxID=421058 RepID=UPI0031D1C3AB
MTVDEIYLNIGQSIVNAIEDESWSEAKLNIEVVGTGVVSYNGEYTTDNNEVKNISVRNISRDIRNWIRELHDITTEGDSNKWNKAIFNLNAQGKFNMEFIWDQELHDEIVRLSKE